MIVLDDIEEENNTATPEKREKIRDWLFGQVLPSLDPVSGRLIFVGTIVHEDALLARLHRDPPAGWVVRKYSILNEAGESIWPERFPKSKIMEIKEEYARSGALMRFMMEYMNNPAAAEFRVFDKNSIRYYNPFSIQGELRNYMAVDFGYAVSGDSDFTVVMVGGIDDSSNIYVREYVRKRMKPNETLQTIVDLYNRYNCSAVGIETNGPQKIYYYMLDEHAKSSSLHNLRIIELSHSIKKETRILNLQPKFQDGKIFILPDMVDLESELIKFTPQGRSSGHDDTIDTLSNLVMTMNKANATAPRKRNNPMDYMQGDTTSGFTYYLP
jgi:predicted phage terminase large subunit-like protein